MSRSFFRTYGFLSAMLLAIVLGCVLGALWLTSRAGGVYLAWWLPLVGAACYYVLRRRCRGRRVSPRSARSSLT